jgi:hypothetical protein
MWLLAFMMKSQSSLVRPLENILFRTSQNSSFNIVSDNSSLLAIIYYLILSLYEYVLCLLRQVVCDAQSALSLLH